MKLRVVGALAIALSGGLALPGPSVAGDGAVLRISVTGTDIAKLEPHRATSTTDKAAVDWIFNGLVRFAPGSADPKDIEPDLAERWERLVDGKTWTLHLREDVAFHGTWRRLTADDVVYSLKRAADPARSSFAGSYAAIQDVEALDPSGVRARQVIMRHGLRNALTPIITVVGLYFGTLIGNSVLTEIVFNRPGLGKLILGASLENLIIAIASPR